MGLMSFTTAPVEVTKQIKKQKSIIAKGIKAKSSRRKVDTSATIYGDELFQAAYRPTKAIVVKFHPFTLNLIRVETEGRFAIQYYKATDRFLLYRFLLPITYEWSELEFQIPITENIKTYGPFEHVESIRDKILEILKRQLLEERAANKQLAIDLENQEKLAKEKAQDEADKIAEQLGSSGVQAIDESSKRKTEITNKESTQEKGIPQEISKEENKSTFSLDEIRKPTTNFITKVDKITDFKDLDKIAKKEEVDPYKHFNDPLIKKIIEDSNETRTQKLLNVETNFEGKTEVNSVPDFDDKIVTIWKREGNQVKLVVKLPKSKAEKWIEGKANCYIK